MLLAEIWKPVEGYEGFYEVSDRGNIKSLHRNPSSNRALIKNKSGYIQVNLSGKGKIVMKYVHRLVATAFLENINRLPTVNHIDGIRDNNNLSNLEWCSQSQNIRHAFYVTKNRSMVGENNPANKLSNEIRNKIIQLKLEGMPSSEVSKLTNLTTSRIANIMYNFRKRKKELSQ